jgi:hypothetical protein
MKGKVYTGKKGGHYRIHNGKKVYVEKRKKSHKKKR